ncbi:hypothetical protein ISS96_03190 [Candidatus Bathyarchaeota archaeon]|nr:hypothetical protein [Candidatus Bathyarchaeota archaeon]
MKHFNAKALSVGFSLLRLIILTVLSLKDRVLVANPAVPIACSEEVLIEKKSILSFFDQNDFSVFDSEDPETYI